MGAGLSIQPFINAQIAETRATRSTAAMISVLVSTVSMLTGAGHAASARQTCGVGDAPPVDVTGGMIGAFVVLAALTRDPRLGAAITIAIFIAGQLAMSLWRSTISGCLGFPSARSAWRASPVCCAWRPALP